MTSIVPSLTPAMASKALGAGASRRPAWATDVVWSVSHAVNDGYPSLYLALLPVLMLRWHFHAGQAGLLTGLVALSTQALQPVMGWSPTAVAVPGSLSADSSSGAWAPPSDWRRPFVRRVRRRAHGGWPGQWAFHPHMAALVTRADPTQPGRRMSGWMVSGMVGHALAPLAVVLLWHWARQLGIGSSGRSRADRGRLALRFGTRIAPAHTASRAVFGRIVEYSPTTRPAILFGGGVAQSGNGQSAHAAAHSVA